MSSLSKARKELLRDLEEIEKDMKESDNERLKSHVATLHKKVKALFEATDIYEKENKKRIRKLEEEIWSLNLEIRQLKGALAEAEATKLWELHVTRFVISPWTKRLKKIYKYQHIQPYVTREKHDGREAERWKQIQHVLDIEWKDEYYENFIRPIRLERNTTAHPSFIDLDEIRKISMEDADSEEQELYKAMFDMLELTASLMKFGKLAKDFQENISWFPNLSFSNEEHEAVKMMVEWERDFTQFHSGLQCIEHSNAMEYVKKYVDDEDKYASCTKVADAIKEVNKKRLVKLAWAFKREVLEEVFPRENDVHSIEDMILRIEEFEEDRQECRKKWKTITQGKIWSSEHNDALKQLQHLLPKPTDEMMDVPDIDPESARCTVPDFVDKALWKSALDILHWFEEMPDNGGKRK